MIPRRKERIQKRIHEVVANYILKKYQHKLSSSICVTQVAVTKDLRRAEIFIKSYGKNSNEKEDIQFLSRVAFDIQKEVGRNLDTRFCPQLKFLRDEVTDKVRTVDEIIFQLEEERKGSQERRPSFDP